MNPPEKREGQSTAPDDARNSREGLAAGAVQPAQENDTVVVQRSHRGASVETGSVAPPIPEPSSEPSEWLKRKLAAGAAENALDPERPIALAPGTSVWDHLPTGRGGVSQGLPVVYGPRDLIHTDYGVGSDEVQRQLGMPPDAKAVRVRKNREQLPSLTRKAARVRTATLALYAATLGVSALGLYGVAKLAFGW